MSTVVGPREESGFPMLDAIVARIPYERREDFPVSVVTLDDRPWIIATDRAVIIVAIDVAGVPSLELAAKDLPDFPLAKPLVASLLALDGPPQFEGDAEVLRKWLGPPHSDDEVDNDLATLVLGVLLQPELLRRALAAVTCGPCEVRVSNDKSLPSLLFSAPGWRFKVMGLAPSRTVFEADGKDFRAVNS